MKRVILIIAIAIAASLLIAIPAFADVSECQHEWSEWTVTEEPTCGNPGLETRFCTLCFLSEEQVIPATGKHDWDGWYVASKATVFKKGTKKRECQECGKTQSKAIAKLKPFAKFKNKTYKLKAGKTKGMKSQVKMARGDSIKKWSSSNTGIAAITKAGKLKAKKAGIAKITVTLKSGKKTTCKIKVKAKKRSGGSSGSGIVYWVPNGSVYHSTKNCPTLSRSRIIKSGPLSSCPKPRPCKVCH